MYKKLPFILNFEDLWDIYSMAGLYNPRQDFPGSKESEIIFDKEDPSFKNSVLGIGEEKRKKILELLTKYKKELDEIESAMLEFVYFQIIQDPHVYIARTKDIKTGIEYFTAKTFFPLKGGRKKEVKIYVGKAEDFNNDTMNLQAQSIAKIKMRNTLKRRINVGSL